MAEEEQKLINDATDRVKGYLYQFYTALEYCFSLKQGEKIYIEKYGDITVENLQQIEVKDYSNSLTDTHDNFWNTLYNWTFDSFNSESYNKLILLTTQQIGTKSKFLDWNSKLKEDKFNVVLEIASTYCKKNATPKTPSIKTKVQQMKFIISNENKEKLLDILNKFIILDLSPQFSEIFEDIKNNHAKHIPKEKRENYINGLLGLIINPQTVLNNWEITYEGFTKQVQNLTSIYCANTVIFPVIKKPSEEEISEKSTSLFVDKLNVIEYEEVKKEAICDFLATNILLINDFASYSVNPETIENYENELLKSYNPKRRIYCRKVTNENDKSMIISESKNFYDEIIAESVQPFLNYNDTPKSFRNGFYHIMADDYKNDKKIVWLLKDTENEND